MRVVGVGLLFSAAFLALDSVSMGVFAQKYDAVEYKFNNVVNHIVENKGTGNPTPSSSLNGILVPETDNGIWFPRNKNVASFGRFGCIQVPDSVDVNKGNSLKYRMISLDFRWEGLLGTQKFTQVLYEEGDADAGFNIYLDRLRSGGTARLFMAVWQYRNRLEAQVTRTGKKKIKQGRRYRATMVLDADAGTLSGYLDNDLFDEKDVNFFPLRSRPGGNCLGGMKNGTLIFKTADKAPNPYDAIDFFYFKGKIDNFKIRNERPIASTPAVEYTFTKKYGLYKNTGNGTDLDGIPFPESSNGINIEGTIGAKFSGKGCVQVPDDVDKDSVSDRTITLDFQWENTNADDGGTQVLFEEGGFINGSNIYLDSFDGNNAQLVMAVWKDWGFSHAFVNTYIRANTWYQLSMVLDPLGNSPDGTLTGYLDGVAFDEAGVDFFPIEEHSQNNCLGGMSESTRTFSTDGSGRSTGRRRSGYGLYFNGLIDNFRRFNEVVAGPVLVVEYAFDDSTTETTGNGDPFPSSSLDGILFPEAGNDIEFLLDDSAGSVVARFGGAGCIQVPSCRAINNGGSLGVVGDRTIALDFLWDGTSSSDPQVLFEEGGGGSGINIYLRPLAQQGTADLVMGVWETDSVLSSVFINTTIDAGTWYQTSVILDRINGAIGTLAGYVQGAKFGEKVVDFFGVRPHSQDNCLGGKKSQTRIMGSSDGSPGDGFYFHGLIDNFQLFNSVEIPTVPSTA